MGSKLIIALICFGFVSHVYSWNHGEVVNVKYETSVYDVIEIIQENLISWIDIFITEFGLDDGEEYIAGFENIEDSPEERITCLQCTSFLQLFKSLIAEGNDFEDVRDLAIDLCRVAVNVSEEWDGSIMCPGLVDNYGPHVFYILNVTNSSALEICTLYNVCDPVTAFADTRKEYEHNRNVEIQNTNVNSKSFNKANAIKVLHLTDIHIDHEYAIGSATDCNLPTCCRDYWPGEGEAWYWGSYPCNLPLRTMELFLAQWSTLEPDYIMYTGDSPPHSVWDETQQGQLNISKYVAEAIERNFPGVPAYPVIGNHETFPANLYYIERPEIQEFNREFRQYWQSMANFTQDQIENVEYAGFYTLLVRPGFRVIAYNSNYGYNANFYGIITKDSEEYHTMLQFLEDSFEAARNQQERVILLGHHPSGTSSTFVFYSQWLSDLLVRYGDLVVLHLSGHRHGDLFNMVMDQTTSTATDIMISSPSSGSRTDINPTGRMFYLDPDSLIAFEYDNYFFNLTKYQDATTEPVLELFYNSKEEYGLTDLTPLSYNNFTDRMEQDDDLWYKYRFNERTGTRDVGPCDGECKTEAFCELRSSSYDQYLLCVNQ